LDEEDAVSESAIEKVKLMVGKSGEAFYTATYRNGEPGPRSEGYRGATPQAALRAAREAAERDFPGIPVVLVDDD
jgi:hypothetical protein